MGINVMKSDFTDGKVISSIANDFPSVCPHGTFINSDKEPMINFYT